MVLVKGREPALAPGKGFPANGRPTSIPGAVIDSTSPPGFDESVGGAMDGPREETVAELMTAWAILTRPPALVALSIAAARTRFASSKFNTVFAV